MSVADLKAAGYEVEDCWEHPDPDVDEKIVRVTGHGIDTTIYTHDDESIERLLAAAGR